MRITYLTHLTTSFNPFSRASRVPRLFLNNLPANANKLIQIKCTTLSQASRDPAVLELAFKDGQKMRYEWSEEDAEGTDALKEKEGKKKKKVATLQGIIAEVDRHARIAERKEELNG